MELEVLNQTYWKGVYDKYDKNGDGTINIIELKQILESREYENDIPDHVVKAIFKRADRNFDGKIDFAEFMQMIQHPETGQFFSHLKERAKLYVKFVVPRPKPPTTTVVDGVYEEEYSCWPPAVIMIIISLIEVVLYCLDYVVGYEENQVVGSVGMALLYDPHRRKECWRYVTYMFVHIGPFHLIVNIFVQIMLGIPLEMVHRGWRVVLIYLAGVVAGSLGTSVADPGVKLAGASGGVYSLITAHFATIIMNWSEMSYPFVQLVIFIILTASDVGTAIYNRYVLDLDESIGYAAHFFGGLAGLLVGITVLRNIEVKKAEKVLRLVAMVVYILLMGVAIVWNASVSSYFPEQYV